MARQLYLKGPGGLKKVPSSSELSNKCMKRSCHWYKCWVSIIHSSTNNFCMLFGVLFFHIFNLETLLKHPKIQLNWNSTVYFQILVTIIISKVIQVVHVFFPFKLLRIHPKGFLTDSSLTSFFIHTFTQKLHSNFVTWKMIRTL